MLELKEIAKSYGKNEDLSSINFKVEQGKIIGLVGENGAGKSTLLNIIATLNKPTRGTKNYNDLNYHKNIKRIRKKIGYVPQEIAIWEHLSVRENMLFFEQLRSEDHTSELKSRFDLVCRLLIETK